MDERFKEVFDNFAASNDELRLTELRSDREEVEAQYYRHVDPLDDVDPYPVPHRHMPYVEKARPCLLFGLFAIVVGLGITVSLAVMASRPSTSFSPRVAAILSNPSVPDASTSRTTVAVILGVFVFLILTAIAHVHYTHVPHFRLLPNFRRYLQPLLIALTASICTFFVGRLPSIPALAAVIASIDPFNYLLMEMSLAALGGLLLVGYKRFLTTDELTTQHEQCTKEIAVLERRNVQRKARSTKDALTKIAVALLLLFITLPFPTASAQTILIDRTGSVANQEAIENRLISSLVPEAAPLPSVTIVLFSEDVFGATATNVRLGGEVQVISPFTGVQNAARANAASHAEGDLRRALARRLPVAHCSSSADIMNRAINEAKPVLLVADLRDDCGTTAPAVPLSDDDGVFIVLVRSKEDVGSDTAVFNSRSNVARSYFRHARIFPLFKMDEAVAQFAAFYLQPSR